MTCPDLGTVHKRSRDALYCSFTFSPAPYINVIFFRHYRALHDSQVALQLESWLSCARAVWRNGTRMCESDTSRPNRSLPHREVRTNWRNENPAWLDYRWLRADSPAQNAEMRLAAHFSWEMWAGHEYRISPLKIEQIISLGPGLMPPDCKNLIPPF